jgi:transposase
MRRQEIIDWLVAKGIELPTRATKVNLLQTVSRHREPPRFAVSEIAGENHEVLFTPPYHPELQPIEKIWGVMKNRIAAEAPAKSMSELLENVLREYAKVRPNHWTGAYKKSRHKRMFSKLRKTMK